ncbi:hypothetical protein SNEBB_004472 [Seison nebaliae]|nr:hypothetical protein SNEBB_004472 [Seison nebaliae]
MDLSDCETENQSEHGRRVVSNEVLLQQMNNQQLLMMEQLKEISMRIDVVEKNQQKNNINLEEEETSKRPSDQIENNKTNYLIPHILLFDNNCNTFLLNGVEVLVEYDEIYLRTPVDIYVMLKDVVKEIYVNTIGELDRHDRRMVIFRYNINIKKTEETPDVVVNALLQIIHYRIAMELMEIHLKTIDELYRNDNENLSVKENIIGYRKEVRHLKIAFSTNLFPKSISIDNTSEFQYSFNFVQFIHPAIRSELNRLHSELMIDGNFRMFYYPRVSDPLKSDIHLLLFDYIQKDLTSSNHSWRTAFFSMSGFKKYVDGRSDIKVSEDDCTKFMRLFSKDLINVRLILDCEEDMKDLYNLISTFCDKPYTPLNTNYFIPGDIVASFRKLKCLSSLNSCTINDKMSHDELYQLIKYKHRFVNRSMMKMMYPHFTDYFDEKQLHKRDGAQIFSTICNVNLVRIDEHRSVGGSIFFAILNLFRIRKGEINHRNVNFLYQETLNFMFEKKSLVTDWLVNLLMVNNSMYIMPVAAAEIIFIMEQKADVKAALNNKQTKENILNRFISIRNCSEICDIVLGHAKMEKDIGKPKINQHETFDDAIKQFFSKHAADDSSPVLNSVVDMMLTATNTEIMFKYGIYVFDQIMTSTQLKIAAHLSKLNSSSFERYDVDEFKYDRTLNDFDDWFPSYVGKLKLVIDFNYTPSSCDRLRLDCNNYYHFANRNEKFGSFASFHYYVMLLVTYENWYCEDSVKFVLRADKIRYTLRDITNNSSFRSQFEIFDDNELNSIIEEFENNGLIHRIGSFKSRRLIDRLIKIEGKGESSKDDCKFIVKLLTKFEILREISSVNGLIKTEEIGTRTQISDSSTNSSSSEQQISSKKFINCSIGTDIGMVEY